MAQETASYYRSGKRGLVMKNTRQSKKPLQRQLIKKHLLTGRSITTWQAIQLYKITSLPKRISELRRLGLPIQSHFVSNEESRFCEYWLDAETIKRYQSTSEGGQS